MGTVEAIEFAGVGTIPHLVIKIDGVYEYVPVKTGITKIVNIKLEEE